jgi:predicted N-acetyltransferase YhbS
MIRQFQPADAEACCEVIHSCLALDTQISRTLYDALRTRETPQAMRKRSNLFYLAVCEADSSVIGVAGLDMNEVRLLYVSPENQSRGIGGALLDHLEMLVPSSLFADIFVYSTPSAARFYRSRGFKAAGEYSFDLNGEQLQTIFMRKPLPPGLVHPKGIDHSTPSVK